MFRKFGFYSVEVGYLINKSDSIWNVLLFVLYFVKIIYLCYFVSYENDSEIWLFINRK